MRHRILLVDDQQDMLNLFSSVLKDWYTVATAKSAEDALVLVQAEAENPFSVVVADIFMPGISGIEFLAQCAKLSPDTVRIAVTGDPGRDTVVDSVNEGNVFRFVSKPVRIETFVAIIEAAVERYESMRVEREMMETTVRTSVNLLLEVLATIDPPSFELSQRVRGSVRVFARAMKFQNTWELELAASLARIGTVALPAEVLQKVSREIALTSREAEMAAQVPQLGAQLLKPIPRLGRVAEAIRYQSKNFDGSGSPSDAVAGFQIPIAARILRIFVDRAVLEIDGVAKRDAYRQMAQRTGVYDLALLDAAFDCFPDYILSSVSAEKEVRLVSAEDLHPDLTLVTEIRTNERLLLVASGTRLTPLIVQRIRTHVTLGSVTGPFGVQPANSDEVKSIAHLPPVRVAS